MTDEAPPPLLRIVAGDATEEELAALVAVVASLGAAEPPSTSATPAWQSHHRKVRVTMRHGAGGWRNSALPR